jgi:hypothetical protein
MLDRYKCGKKIVAGGPAARHRVALTVEADTTGQVDDLISSLPPWTVAETRVTPLIG